MTNTEKMAKVVRLMVREGVSEAGAMAGAYALFELNGYEYETWTDEDGRVWCSFWSELDERLVRSMLEAAGPVERFEIE